VIQVNIKFLPLSLNTAEAADFIGSPQVFDDMRRARWLAPVVERHKLVQWDRGELEKCYARLRTGQYPGKAQ